MTIGWVRDASEKGALCVHLVIANPRYDLGLMRFPIALTAALIAIAAAALAACTPQATAAPPAIDLAHPTVIELFTSQGCSSCPPADANVAKLADRPDVIALSFGVTYWDRLGWKDTFADPRYTARQVDYGKALGNPNVFTPQVVVNGRDDVVGARTGQIEGLMKRVARTGGPEVAIASGRVSIGAAAAPKAPADVWLVRYDPHVIRVPIRAGENTGKTLPHRNVVRDLSRLGAWSGAAASFPVAAKPGLATAVLVQAPHGGPILAAAKSG
jgi:hypothetical protein